MANESRDRATIRALRQIDSDLAGLFELGRELCNQPDRPGLPYLLAHAGRELTNCVIDQLKEEDSEITEPLVSESGSKEEQRYRLASALGLSPNHEVVRKWFRVHKVFQSRAHARVPGPKIGPLRTAFSELADLLYGRIGDYFQTQAEIDAIADSPDPTGTSLERLHHLLIRPVQRERFFSRLERREWLEPLTAGGFFRNPPLGRQVFADGSWRPRPWPEGKYLLRMASIEPARVLDILLAVPDKCENPNVWFSVADMLIALPIAQGVALVPKLARALESPYSRVFAFKWVEVTAHLAKARRSEAFLLVEALLWLNQQPSLPDQPADSSFSMNLESLRNRRRELSWNDKWILARIDDYEYEQLSEQVFPELRALDGLRLLELLAERLERANRLVTSTKRAFDGAISRTAKEADPEGRNNLEYDFNDQYDNDSRHWCKDLRHIDHTQSIRAHLAVATYRTGLYLGDSGTRLGDVMTRLESRNSEIFTRMVYGLIAESEKLDRVAKSRLSRFVASEDATDPSFGATETAALLRAHFVDAPRSAQRKFLRAVRDGPSEEYVVQELRFWEEEDTPENRTTILEDWQRKRLRWFHEQIPSALQTLAKRLRVVAEKPTHRQQSLDETGSWSSGVHSAGTISPVSWQVLAAMSSDEFAEYLRTWHPIDGTANRFDSASLEGLEHEVSELATRGPERLGQFLAAIVRGSIPIRFITAMLRGLRSAVQSHEVGLEFVSTLSRYAWIRAEEMQPTTPQESQLGRWAADAVSDLLVEFIDKRKPDKNAIAELWSLLRSFVDSELAWHDDPEAQVTNTYAKARHESFARTSGRLTSAVFALAWHEFILQHEGTKWPPPMRTEVSDSVIPILETILRRDGPAAFAAHGVFGQWLVQLLWFAHEWTMTQLPTLLDNGSERPGTRPAWSVYVDSTGPVPYVFQILRPWYAHHAAALPDDASDPHQDPGSELAGDFAAHIIFACAWGECSPGDPDDIVENTFNRSPVKARNHAYWAVFRSMSDAKRTSRKVIRNLPVFWESRIRALESVSPSAARDEELDGLCWFIATPHLPSDVTIRLGQRTTKLLSRKSRISGVAWKRLAALAKTNPAGTFVIVEQLVDRILRGEFVYLAFDEIAPSLRRAIAAGGEVRDRALRLVNRIGDAGYDEFGILWQEAQNY